MAINVYGTSGSIDIPHWNQLFQDLGDAVGGMQVMSGLSVTAAAGTRQVSVAIGRSLQCGTYAFNDAAQTVTLTANSSGLPRIDTVCMQVDCTGTQSGAGTLVAVPGVPKATPTPPALTQVPGGIWQTPLANIAVASGATTLTSGMVTDARPGIVAGAVAVTVPGNFSADATVPLMLQMAPGGIVEFGGHFGRTSTTLTVGDANGGINAVIIPVGFRPVRRRSITCWTSVLSAPKAHLLTIFTDGTATLNAGTGNIAPGDTIRVDSTHWIGA